jgi:mannose-6-phosphate isomerase-like protein (cupin superfamily)
MARTLSVPERPRLGLSAADGGGQAARSVSLVVVAPDDVIRLFDGSEYRMLERPSRPGDAVIMEFRLPDRCAEPLPHVHPHNVEVFGVLEGEVELLFGSEWRTVRAGESVTVPAGARHTFRNHSGRFAAFRNVHDPHHEFEAYLRKLTTLQNELHQTSPTGPVAAARFAMVVGEHPDLLHPADVPMKLAMPILRTLGKGLRLNVPD